MILECQRYVLYTLCITVIIGTSEHVGKLGIVISPCSERLAKRIKRKDFCGLWSLSISCDQNFEFTLYLSTEERFYTQNKLYVKTTKHRR